MGRALLGVLVASVLALLAGCGPAPPVEYSYQPPKQTDDGLPVGTLDEVGIDPDLLGRAVDEIRDGRWGEVYSLLLYTDGRLVFEEYFPGHDYQWDAPDFHGAWTDWDRNSPHNVHSVGKSLTTACVGIAVDEGFVAGVGRSTAPTLTHDHGSDRSSWDHGRGPAWLVPWDSLASNTEAGRAWRYGRQRSVST